ncbi:hypothetical protein Tco_1083388, partial [Tanacetum coccineum]
MCIPFTGIAQFPDVAHNLEILQDQEDCDESERSGKKSCTTRPLFLFIVQVRIFRPFRKDIPSIHDSFSQELLCF